MIQGVIGRVRDSQFGSKIFYSFALNGQEGWYGTGTKKPPREGTSVRFNEKTNAKGYKEVDGGIEILTDGQVAPAGNISSTTGAQPTQSKGQSAYWDRKETRDLVNDAARELGATRNTALAFIDLGLKYEVFKLPAAAKREEFLKTLWDKYTKELMGKETKADEEREDVADAAGPDVGDGDNWN